MKASIQKAGTHDLDGLAALYDEVNDYLAGHINYPGWIKGVYPTRQDAEQGFSENALFTAKINGEIVGSVILNHRPEKAYHGVKWLTNSDYANIIVIHTLVVHPKHQQHGVGQTIMGFIHQYAADNQMRSIRLDVYQKNLPAIKLYEKNQYTYIDTVDLGLGRYSLNLFRLYERLV